MAFYFYKNTNGKPTEMMTLEAGGTIAAGDVVVVNGSTMDEVIALASTNVDTVVGVAVNSATDGDDVLVIPGTHNNLFKTTSGATGYTDASHKFTQGLLDATSMNVNVAGSTTGSDGFIIVGYVPDEDYVDGGTNNAIYGYFASCELD